MNANSLLISCLCALLCCVSLNAQKIPYGNNPAAGHYVVVDDTKLYYEIYGQGEPLVMLHGGVYGYIDEFAPFIPKLTEKFKVILIATRAHGKSGIGKSAFTYAQRATDAFNVIKSITRDSVTVLGFSDGGMSALKLAAEYPELVKRLIAIGVNDHPQGSTKDKYHYSRETLMKEDSAFFASRLSLMPEPQRWDEVLEKLNRLYNDDYMSVETFSKIKCPTLIMSGDRDHYSDINSVVHLAKSIDGAQL